MRRLLAALIGLAAIGALIVWLPGGRSVTEPAEALPPEERALRQAVGKTPESAAAHRELGAYLLRQGRPHAAIWSFQGALQQRAGDLGARLGLVRALTAAGLPRVALAALADGARQPANDEAGSAGSGADLEQRRAAAEAYLAMADPVGAIGMLSAVRAELNEDGLLMLSISQEAIGDDLNATATLARLLGHSPDHLEGLLAAGRLATRQRRWDEALTVLARARQAAPDEPRSLYLYALAVRARGGRMAESEAPGGAIASLRQVAAGHPTFGPALLELGLWYHRRGQTEAAIRLLERAVALGAGGADARLRLAEALETAGQKAKASYQRGLYSMATQQPARAAREFERMAALDAARPDGWLMLCSASSKLQENGRAASVAARALQRFPDNPRVLARRAQTLIVADDRPAATALCRHWIEKQPQEAEPYRLLGSIARAELRHSEAVRFCEQALARDPGNVEYARELATALLGEPSPRNLRRAAEVLREALRQSPRDAGARFLLGDVLQRLSDREGAREQYLHGMDLDPGDRRGALGLSQVCSRLGQRDRVALYGRIVRALQEREDRARDLWRHVFRQSADADAHAQLASLLLEASDFEQARQQLAQAVALQPGRKVEKTQLAVVDRLLEIRQTTPMRAIE